MPIWGQGDGRAEATADFGPVQIRSASESQAAAKPDIGVNISSAHVKPFLDAFVERMVEETIPLVGRRQMETWLSGTQAKNGKVRREEVKRSVYTAIVLVALGLGQLLRWKRHNPGVRTARKGGQEKAKETQH
jgi:hypothetical protein